MAVGDFTGLLFSDLFLSRRAPAEKRAWIPWIDGREISFWPRLRNELARLMMNVTRPKAVGRRQRKG
jgi:hypothetical protein